MHFCIRAYIGPLKVKEKIRNERRVAPALLTSPAAPSTSLSVPRYFLSGTTALRERALRTGTQSLPSQHSDVRVDM